MPGRGAGRRLPPTRPGASWLAPSRRPRQIRHLLLSLALVALLTPGPGCGILPNRSPAPAAQPLGPAPTWQWQLSGELDLTVDAEVFVLDPFTTPTEATQRLRAYHRRLVCQVDAGRYDGSRPDSARFPAELIGRAAGADGLRWLDIRRWELLEPILADRFRLCRGKGFDAVLPVGVDGYAQQTGFPLTFDDQLAFNRRLAALARSLSLSPGLDNNLAQVTALEPEFDFAVNEECVRFKRCDRLLPFVNAGKPVLHVEYQGATADFCVTTLGYGFVSMRKHRDLGVWRAPCLR